MFIKMLIWTLLERLLFYYRGLELTTSDPIFFQKIMFKIFLKLLGVTRTRIRILGSGSIKKFIKTAKCKWFRIRTWSGSANHTKLNANASGSRFLNLDSGIFMRTPDSHRICTIRYGPPPPDLIGLELLLCKGYSASKASEKTRECYALKPDHTIQVR
jgi:hypothetical protein